MVAGTFSHVSNSGGGRQERRSIGMARTDTFRKSPRLQTSSSASGFASANIQGSLGPGGGMLPNVLRLPAAHYASLNSKHEVTGVAIITAEPS